MYVYIVITVKKTTYLDEKYFRLTSLSIHLSIYMYIWTIVLELIMNRVV